MRACVQRVREAHVMVGDQVTGRIGSGSVVLLGIAPNDTEAEVTYLADKIAGLRIFDDPAGKMNLSLVDVGGSMLVVSQFTLYGDCRKGRRPSFIGAALPAHAEPLYELFLAEVRRLGVPVAAGVFRASMQVSLVNDGPVTLWLDTAELR